MGVHYYLGWFNEYFPEKLIRVLRKDIEQRKSLVMISANPSYFDETGKTERSWLEQAGIIFDEYYLINYNIKKEEAQTIVRKASVVFLLGGNTLKQNELLKEYDLIELIRTKNGVIMGASAGAINMSVKWICSNTFGSIVGKSFVCSGIGLDDFSMLSHHDLENSLESVPEELSNLSEIINVYVSNKDCALRVNEGKMDIIGDVYLISKKRIQKLKEMI